MPQNKKRTTPTYYLFYFMNIFAHLNQWNKHKTDRIRLCAWCFNIILSALTAEVVWFVLHLIWNILMIAYSVLELQKELQLLQRTIRPIHRASFSSMSTCWRRWNHSSAAWPGRDQSCYFSRKDSCASIVIPFEPVGCQHQYNAYTGGTVPTAGQRS